MRPGTWGKDILVGLGLAELAAAIAWAAGAASDLGQAVALLAVWPLATLGVRRARRKAQLGR